MTEGRRGCLMTMRGGLVTLDTNVERGCDLNVDVNVSVNVDVEHGYR